jgi:ubiquinone/menaquinone biosynthesis C-methylase UbiE
LAVGTSRSVGCGYLRGMSNEAERNAAVFNQAHVVADYREATHLTAAEESIFGRFVQPGMDTLDLGVGAGRTTPVLRALANRYVGVDYAPAMVTVAREQHPGVDFRVGDASDLSDFADESFDAVVFSFNGIDYLHPVKDRSRCLAECQRVLRPGGVFILSSHNARMMLPILDLRDVGLLRRFRRIGGWLYRTPKLVWRRTRCSTFWNGHGYVLDPVRGGLTGYEATPVHLAAELGAAGFTLAETVPSTYPRTRSRLCVPWYYYAFLAPGGGE